MSRRSLQVPSIVRARAAAAGPAGERWLADLPDTVAAAEAGWSVVVGEQLGGGTAAFVARAVTAAGAAAVVKIAVPELGFPRRVRTLAVAEGRGYVRLLAQDLERDAVLLKLSGCRWTGRGWHRRGSWRSCRPCCDRPGRCRRRTVRRCRTRRPTWPSWCSDCGRT